MDGTESKKIAEAWVNFQRNWWAWDKLDELCRKDAKGAWGVLVELVEVAEGDDLLEDIGVGPLEDFVNYYATDYIDEIESAARASAQLSAALAHVQLRDVNHEMAVRIAALGCRTSSAAQETDDFDENP
ncbi:MAG: hypothetical protein O3C28_06945 [Proteobacteria bacterium]|jgi:hypothetical protein|nr:hypothetical protein [Pseudomonadota bacterium]